MLVATLPVVFVCAIFGAPILSLFGEVYVDYVDYLYILLLSQLLFVYFGPVVQFFVSLRRVREAAICGISTLVASLLAFFAGRSFYDGLDPVWFLLFFHLLHNLPIQQIVESEQMIDEAVFLQGVLLRSESWYNHLHS